MMGLQLIMYMAKIRILPKGGPPSGFSAKEVLLKSFRLRLLEECPWLPSGLLKKLLIGCTTPERNFFLGFLGLCELSFAMLTVRDNELSWSYRSFGTHAPR